MKGAFQWCDKSELRNNEGLLFIDIISLSDIAFVISVINNGWDVWDQKIRMKELGAAVHGERKVKVRPLFTEGTWKKKEQGKSLWSDEGIKYFQRADKTQRKVYKDKETMRGIYGGFETWLNNIRSAKQDDDYEASNIVLPCRSS